METNERIVSLLEHLPPEPEEEIQHVIGNVRITARLKDSDRIGCLLDRIDLKHRDGVPVLMNPAEVSKRLTYLGEPICVIETDNATGYSVLRSGPPREEKGLVMYFELIIDRAEGVSLIRRQYNRTEKKHQNVPVPMTHETLARLLHDLTDLAGKEH